MAGRETVGQNENHLSQHPWPDHRAGYVVRVELPSDRLMILDPSLSVGSSGMGDSPLAAGKREKSNNILITKATIGHK